MIDNPPRALEATEFEEEPGMTLGEMIAVLREHLKLLTLGPLAAGLLALGVAFVIPPTFTARTAFLTLQQTQGGAASALASLDALAGLAGNRILLPAAPGFVFAGGALANNNALLWRKGRTVKQYLLAAGVEPTPDEDNIFIVRADGSIVHRRDGGRLFSSFESTELAQGDTLVVPEKVDLESKWSGFVRGFKDWTQILANLGLTAAAINSLGR